MAHLDRSALSDNTTRAYRSQASAYVAWLVQHQGRHRDAFRDRVGAERAVGAYRKHLLATLRRAPATVGQALVAVSILYQQAQIPVKVTRPRVPLPDDADALDADQLELFLAETERHSARDQAIIYVLLYCGLRRAECAGLDLADMAISARAGEVRVFGKGGQVRSVPVPVRVRRRVEAWLLERGSAPGPLWYGQKRSTGGGARAQGTGRLTAQGVTRLVERIAAAARLDRAVTAHDLRHTFAHLLREGGADVAQIQKWMGHSSVTTTARYFRASKAEQRAVMDRIFGDDE